MDPTALAISPVHYRYIHIRIIESRRMDLPGKTKYSILGFMLTFILMFKYPSESHEYGKDSFVVHTLAKHLQDLDFAPWLIHPASAYALYPFSYAPGMSFLLVSLSDLSGLSIELVILIFSIILSFVGVFGMFMFTSEISDRFDVKFVAAFLFAFTPALSTYLTWTMSTRGPFICIMTLILWAFARTINARHKLKIFIVALILLFIIPTIHHFFLLFPIVLLAYLASYITVLGLEHTNRVSIYYRENVMIASVLIFAFMVFLFYLQATSVDIYAPDQAYFKVWFAYGEEDSPLTLAINIIVYYGTSMGVLMLLGGVGLANVLGNIHKSRVEWTLLYLIIFFTLFLVDKKYLKIFVAPLFLPLLAIGFVAIMNKIEYRKDLYVVIFSTLLFIAASHGSFATQQWSDVRTVEETGYHHYMNDGTYNSGVYVRHTMFEVQGPIAIHNDAVDKNRITAVSGMPMLYLNQGQELVVNPNLTENISIEQHSLSDMYYEHIDTRYYVDWENSDINPRSYSTSIISTYWNTTRLESILNESKVQWAIAYTYFPDEHGKSSHPFVNVDSRFFASLPDHRYNIYENDYERIYFLIPVEGGL